MAISQIDLSASMTNNLLALKNTQKLMDMTQERLSTGLKVNSALDNPSAFYAAQALNQRAGDLDSLLDSMGQAIQVLKATDEGITSITKFVEQAKAIAEQASEALNADSTADVSALEDAFNKVLDQIDDMAGDSGYKGTNLLKTGSKLTVYFAEGDRATASKIEIDGVDGSTTGLGLAQAATWTATSVETSINETIAAIDTLRTYASGFSADYNIIANREEFTENLINVLTEGADKLTLADMNEESANMLALQTRQQLGVNALSLASQSAQSVLRLFS